jgi:glycine/D-amino acid oxidase-like deaminating enzyme
MMQVDFLIIGQGISGTWLSYYMLQAGRSFLVIDRADPKASSQLAAGLINPITGRWSSQTWMADTLLPFAKSAYAELGTFLGIEAIAEKSLVHFFPTADMRTSFEKRMAEGCFYTREICRSGEQDRYFQFEQGYGKIAPVYTAFLEKILPAWRARLREMQALQEDRFDPEELDFDNGAVVYRGIQAKKVLFCDGASGATHPLFRNLPYAANKGEALIVSIPDLPSEHIYKKGLLLVPLAKPGSWWAGSTYDRTDLNPEPTKRFRKETEARLRDWLKLPFNVDGHVAGIRPATVERRPFVGLHPARPEVGILNGLGTKGCSLAPYLARQLTDHLNEGHPLLAEVDVHRHTRLLIRGAGY